jgi:hypothetical protein
MASGTNPSSSYHSLIHRHHILSATTPRVIDNLENSVPDDFKHLRSERELFYPARFLQIPAFSSILSSYRTKYGLSNCKSMLHVQSFDLFISETRSRRAAISDDATTLTHKLFAQPTLINFTMPTQITSRSVNGGCSKHNKFYAFCTGFNRKAPDVPFQPTK